MDRRSSGRAPLLTVRTVLLCLAVLLACAPADLLAAGPAFEILPYEQVRAGMRGEGRTVFKGTEPESFEVEILGTLDRIGPGQNMILARLIGPTVERTGVMEGMSGSPVYVQGKIIGAVAYSWAFAREPIAGITPIEEMLAIPKDSESPASRGSGAGALGPRRGALRLPDLAAVGSAAARFDASLAHLFGAVPASAGPGSPLGLAVSASGLAGAWIGRRVPALAARIALAPSPSGSGEASAESPPGSAQDAQVGVAEAEVPLRAGDAVGAQLARGEIELTAYGTVTRVEGPRVLAMGHPFLQLGAVDYPMTRARVETLFPSLASSFKVVSSGPPVGAFHQDRAAGLAGRLGARARTLPVRIELQHEGDAARAFAYEIVDDPLLTPVLLYLTVGGILTTTQRGPGDASVELREGSVLLVGDEERAELANLFAGPDAVAEASAWVGLVADAILTNPLEPVRVKGVNLLLRYSDTAKSARITGAWADRRQVRPGEHVVLTVGLLANREGESLETIPIEIPTELAPGRLTIHVGDARTLTRIEQSGADGRMPLSLGHLLDLINSFRRNQSLSILGTREEPSILIGSEPFPNLPPSRAALILRGEGRGGFPILRTRAILDETRDSDYEIEGYRRIELEVVR